jgi:hypothetical protein
MIIFIYIYIKIPDIKLKTNPTTQRSKKINVSLMSNFRRNPGNGGTPINPTNNSNQTTVVVLSSCSLGRIKLPPNDPFILIKGNKETEYSAIKDFHL